MHLDVKPANIFKKEDGYKLGDFGLALHLDHGHASAGSIEEGDCRYMARELLDWAPVKDLTKCDVFSLGLTAYELLTNQRLPVNGPQWHALRNGDIDWSAVQASSELKALLKSMLAPEPIDRPTAQQCLDRVVSILPSVRKDSLLNSVMKASRKISI